MLVLELVLLLVGSRTGLVVGILPVSVSVPGPAVPMVPPILVLMLMLPARGAAVVGIAGLGSGLRSGPGRVWVGPCGRCCCF
jgi:hypothetical protein